MNALERVDNYLLTEGKKRREEKVTPLNVFYPSSAGQCIRKLWNEKKNPPEFPAKTYKHFLIGNLVHEWLQSKIYSDGETEVPIRWSEGDINFSGRIDTKYPDRLIDFKTIKDLSYVRSAPKSEHIRQLNMYMHATGIHKGTLVYVTKNELDILEHDINYDPELYAETVKDFKKVYKYLLKDKEPKPAKCPSPWSCEYCKADRLKAQVFIKRAIQKKKLKGKALSGSL